MEEIRNAAQEAFKALCEAVFAFVALHEGGVRNDEVAKGLSLETNFEGGQRNYLTFTALIALVQCGRLMRDKKGSRVYYMLPH